MQGLSHPPMEHLKSTLTTNLCRLSGVARVWVQALAAQAMTPLATPVDEGPPGHVRLLLGHEGEELTLEGHLAGRLLGLLLVDVHYLGSGCLEDLGPLHPDGGLEGGAVVRVCQLGIKQSSSLLISFIMVGHCVTVLDLFFHLPSLSTAHLSAFLVSGSAPREELTYAAMWPSR